MNTLLVVSCMKRKVTLRQALCCRPAPVFPVAETRLRHFRKMARLLLAGNIPGESIKSPRDLIGGGRAPLPRSRRRLLGQKALLAHLNDRDDLGQTRHFEASRNIKRRRHGQDRYSDRRGYFRRKRAWDLSGRRRSLGTTRGGGCGHA